MEIEILPLVSFVLITTFTPGPNNMSSAAMGVNHGYRKTLHYLLGISVGFFLVMMICAYLASALLTVVPAAERVLRWVGALYILWLAFGILRSTYVNGKSESKALAFTRGFVLQLVNPKVAVYGLMLYSTFLAPISGRLGYLSLSALAFALVAFFSTSTWALFGTAIKNKLQNERVKTTINVLLALLLVYTALELSGVLEMLKAFVLRWPGTV